MAEFKHLVIAKFKEDVNVEEILKGMEKLVSEIHQGGRTWTEKESLRRGYSYVFLMTFEIKDNFTKFAGHPSHVQFSATFSAAIEKMALLDFPSVLVKLAETATEEPPPPPPEVAAELAPEMAPEAEPAVA